MYSELIYTRCGEGIDILKNRNPIKNSGFKVFSCTKELTEDGVNDLQLLHMIAQSKESYNDPGFMDDAFIYTVPDIGNKFFLNFHPIPFERNAEGDYSHRPGNFINQVYIGQFADFYPYVLFGNSSVWNAKDKGEAYYYENVPTLLPGRESLEADFGKNCFDEISKFISDGRREVLKKAIAFIISQYSLAPEERKYLVIKDENSSRIELWIAAIELAFSPRMASGLSFATRLDKFLNSNKYTVNLDGQYQTQMNIQNPNQKLRLRAMIVGVDERDKSNVSMVKVMPNLPYVVLDGRDKSLSIDIDVSNKYYQAVTGFNDIHKQVCEFLQMIDISSPTCDVLNAYAAYDYLSMFYVNKQLNDLLSALNILRQFRLVRTTFLEKLYFNIKTTIPNYLEKNPVDTLSVIEWLKGHASVVGDTTMESDFNNAICQTYSKCVYLNPQSEGTRIIHNTIMKSSYANIAVEYLTSENVFHAYDNSVNSYRTNALIAFNNIFIDVLRRKRSFVKVVDVLVPQTVYSLYLTRDEINILKILSNYYSIDPQRTANILLAEASKSSDKSYTGELIKIMCKIITPNFASNKNLAIFFDDLTANKLSNYIPSVLLFKARMLEKTNEMDMFFQWAVQDEHLKTIDLSSVISILDQKLNLSDKSNTNLAQNIQKYKPQNLVCIKSAHIVALSSLGNLGLNNELGSIISGLISQGFPSIEDDIYSDELVASLFSRVLPDDVLLSVLISASRSSYYCEKIAAEVVGKVGKDQIISNFFNVAAKANNDSLFDSLVMQFANAKHFDKFMNNYKNSIKSVEGKNYLGLIETNARQIYEKNRTPSLFERLGKKFSRE